MIDLQAIKKRREAAMIGLASDQATDLIRQDIPDLIEEVEKLRTELDVAEARCLELADELNEANW